MSEHRVALYDAFSEIAFGGSVGAVVSDAGDLGTEQMQAIARELGAPATGFITALTADSVTMRFFSTLAEYPVCGHGTLASMTWLVETGALRLAGRERLDVRLRTPAGTSDVTIERREEGRPRVTLSLAAPRFDAVGVDLHELAALLAIAPAEVSSDAPIELARAEFTHLMVPVGTLATMRRIRPDFSGLADYSRYLRVDTVCAFTRETVDPGNTVHCRDFCPAVGTPESPAAGTTNRGLACYLVRHALVDAPADGTLVVLAEQGHEMGRPSLIRTELTLAGGSVLAVRVGGVATRTLEGTLRAPSPPAATHGDEGARAE